MDRYIVVGIILALILLTTFACYLICRPARSRPRSTGQDIPIPDYTHVVATKDQRTRLAEVMREVAKTKPRPGDFATGDTIQVTHDDGADHLRNGDTYVAGKMMDTVTGPIVYIEHPIVGKKRYGTKRFTRVV